MYLNHGHAGLGVPTVDNFEQHWTSIVDSLVEDSVDYRYDCWTPSTTTSAPSSPSSSFTADSPRTDTAFPRPPSRTYNGFSGSPGPAQTPTRPNAYDASHRLSPTAKCFQQEARPTASPYPDFTPYQCWEQTAAMQSYMFRVQLLTAFMSPEKSGDHKLTAHEQLDTHDNSVYATDGTGSDEGLGVLHLTYHQRTRLSRAEAANRTRRRRRERLRVWSACE